MLLREEKRDLFGVGSDYALAHCIALDCAMGAGIATQFVKRFPQMKPYLKAKVSSGVELEGLTYPTVIPYKSNIEGKDNRVVYNMITKEFSWGKPTYKTFEGALDKLVDLCKEHNVKKLAIPRIGCGLDRLEWSKVRGMIGEKFKDVEIDILVCYI